MSTPQPRRRGFIRAAVSGMRPSPELEVDDDVVVAELGQRQQPLDAVRGVLAERMRSAPLRRVEPP